MPDAASGLARNEEELQEQTRLREISSIRQLRW